MRVALCGLIYSKNLGELMAIDSVRFLINEISQEKIEFVELDIRGIHDRPPLIENTSQDKSKTTKAVAIRIARELKRAMRTLLDRCSIKIVYYLKKTKNEIIWKFCSGERQKLADYFRKELVDVDLVVVVGGGLIEWKNNEYQNSLFVLSDVARELGKPVIINAVGCVGGYDIKDPRCRRMKAALTSDSVKHISVRDHVETMNQFLDHRQAVPQVADSAVWVADAYDISKKTDSNIIGIGLIRGSIYESYGHNYKKSEMFERYQQIIQELEARGYQWKLFSNGFEVDQQIGEDLLSFMGRSSEYLMPRPESVQEVLHNIAQFRGIVTYRLHSCISAYSLEVPFIAISWNNKADEFLRLIGYPERVFSFSQADAIKVVDALEKSIEDGYDAASREKIRQKSKENVRTWLRYMGSKNA